MAISYIGTLATASANQSSLSRSNTQIDALSPQVGDITVACFFKQNENTQTVSGTGWNPYATLVGSGCRMTIATRVHDGTSQTVTISSTGSTECRLIVFILRGSAVGVISANKNNSGSSSTHTCPSSDAFAADGAAVYVAMTAANDSYSTTSGWSEQYSAGGNDTSAYVAVKSVTAGNASGAWSAAGPNDEFLNAILTVYENEPLSIIPHVMHYRRMMGA